MACAPEHQLCLIIGDTRRLQFTLRDKTTQEGISMTGSTFDFRLSERVNGNIVGTNLLNYTSGANPTAFDVTEIGDGLVALLLLSAVTATLDSAKAYLGQFRKITGGEATTLCFFNVTAKARP